MKAWTKSSRAFDQDPTDMTGGSGTQRTVANLIVAATDNVQRVEPLGGLFEQNNDQDLLFTNELSMTWNLSSVTAAFNQVGIDGLTNTASLLSAIASTGNFWAKQTTLNHVEPSADIARGQNNDYFAFFKAGTHDRVGILIRSATDAAFFAEASWLLSGAGSEIGQDTGQTASIALTSIEKIGDFYKCTISCDVLSSSPPDSDRANFHCGLVGPVATLITDTWTSDGTETIIVGATQATRQSVQEIFTNSYIPAEGGTGKREADHVTWDIGNGGADFDGSDYTIIAAVTPDFTPNTRNHTGDADDYEDPIAGIATVFTGNNDYISMGINNAVTPSTFQHKNRDGGVNNVDTKVTESWVIDTTAVYAITGTASSFKSYKNGVEIGTEHTSGTPTPLVDPNVRIGNIRLDGDNNYWGGHIALFGILNVVSTEAEILEISDDMLAALPET